MEWVETTARTVEEAKEQALDQLGVGEDDAEFEVLDEPRAGLFGRVRGEARVHARVRPTSRGRRPSGGSRRKRGAAGAEAEPQTASPRRTGAAETRARATLGAAGHARRG